MAQSACSSLQLAHSAAPLQAPRRTRTRLDVARTEALLCFARASPLQRGGAASRSAHIRDVGVRPSTRLGAVPPEVSNEEAAPEGSPPGTPLTKDTTVGPTAETSPLVRFAWYASEAFGKAVAVFRENKAGEEASPAALDRALSREEAAELLRKDYEQSYFVTGALHASMSRCSAFLVLR